MTAKRNSLILSYDDATTAENDATEILALFPDTIVDFNIVTVPNLSADDIETIFSLGITPDDHDTVPYVKPRKNRKSTAKKTDDGPKNETAEYRVFDRAGNYIPFTNSTLQHSRKLARAWLRRHGFSIRNLKADSFGATLPKNFKTLKIESDDIVLVQKKKK